MQNGIKMHSFGLKKYGGLQLFGLLIGYSS
jgi:hypothetical protein